jgi:hypothetical protein
MKIDVVGNVREHEKVTLESETLTWNGPSRD